MNKLLRIAGFVVVALGLSVATSVRAEGPFGQMISPVSNPVNFEDPRINTEVRPIFVHHVIDDKFVTQGGDVNIYALQLRVAATDRLAIIATKDGFVDLNPNAVVPEDTGLANIAAGVKYAFYMDPAAGMIGTAGIRYEIPTGDEEVLQGNGDGILNTFGSFGMTCDRFNIIAGTGLRIPADDADSMFWDFDAHIDTKIDRVSPLLELNLVHVLSAGKRLPIPDEGQDFFNIGSSGSDGETMLTAAAGARVELAKDVSLGAAYQFPLITGAGTRITDWRLTADLIVSF